METETAPNYTDYTPNYTNSRNYTETTSPKPIHSKENVVSVVSVVSEPTLSGDTLPDPIYGSLSLNEQDEARVFDLVNTNRRRIIPIAPLHCLKEALRQLGKREPLGTDSSRYKEIEAQIQLVESGTSPLLEQIKSNIPLT